MRHHSDKTEVACTWLVRWSSLIDRKSLTSVPHLGGHLIPTSAHPMLRRSRPRDTDDAGRSLPGARSGVGLAASRFYYYHYTLFLPGGKVRLQTSCTKGCQSPTPCWTRARQIQARPNHDQPWARCPWPFHTPSRRGDRFHTRKRQG